MKRRKVTVSTFVAALLFVSTLMPASASISPAELVAVLAPGDSVSETKVVFVPPRPPQADIVFAFDLTGSMGGIINTAKTKAGEIMTALDAIPGVDIQYGVMSYMDYPDYYDSCGYSATYGSAASGDYAYSLDQAVTSDSASVVSAINGLSLGYGGDGPQDYTRIFYESYADPNVSWRSGAKQILVNFGDDVPHDCDLNEGVIAGTWSTGGDPGRDEIMGTGDDLDLQTVLAAMATEGVVLLEAHTNDYWDEYWTYWTGLTGGDVFITGSSSLVDDIVAAVTAALEAPTVSGLHLEASAGFESWLTSVTPATVDVDPGETGVEVSFDLTITVPDGTPAGVYSFTISALDGVGVNYGDQEVTITVRRDVPVDIKPRSCRNPFNVRKKGVLPVAILGTEDFDVTQIDPASVELTGVAPLRWAFEDVATPYEPYVGKQDAFDCTTAGPDGFTDLTFKFNAQEVVAALGDVSDGDVLVLPLNGNLKEEFGGFAFYGEDVVVILK
jgi:hypothetical protein